MAVDLQALQQLARELQDGKLTRESFQAQVQALKTRGMAAGREAAVQRIAPPTHTSAPIVEAGPDVRAGIRTFSWTIALLALAVIAIAGVSAARGDAAAWRLPSVRLPAFDLDRARSRSPERVEDAPEEKPPAAAAEVQETAPGLVDAPPSTVTPRTPEVGGKPTAKP